MATGERSGKPNLRRATTIPGVIEVTLDPLLILAWLLAMAQYLGQGFDPRVLVAGLLVFALTFPGSVLLTDTVPVLLRKSTMTALTALAALALFDYASAWLKAVPRHLFLPWFIALPGLLIGANLLSRAILRRVLESSASQDLVVICGANDIGLGLAQRLRANPYFGVRVLGFFDDRNRERLLNDDKIQYLGLFSQLSDYVREHSVDRIYMALPMASQPRILKLLEDLKDTTASIYFAPDIFVTDLINGRIESVDGMPIVAVRDTPFQGINSMVKRTEDIVLSSLALLFLAPVFVAIVVAIRLDSRGPALFRQKRYGLDGQEINVFKFRSMTVVEDGAAQFTAAKRDDKRITRVGALLRRSSLDELPQLVNVLQGRMSMVGPRPHAVAMNEQFRKLIPGYMLRHKVKPGITGLAQVRGQRGGDDVESLRARIASDLEYLRHWTLLMDLQILARTLPVVLGDKKAY
jgi:putative colanic acid biosynthesis UDP-glucose lipid carrier transferase